MSLTLLSSYIEFPKFGWKFPIDDTIIGFQLFGTEYSIKWYGVIIAFGFLLAVLYGLKRAKDFDLNPDKMLDTALLTTVMAFVGARLYYVFLSEDVADYLADPISILEVWKGGLGIYGGIIFAFVFGMLFSKLFKVSFLSMADIASLGFLIGQAVGRWGNFFNQEAFGGNTDLPWGMTGDVIASGINGNYDPELPVHPTFLYESLWCILGFVLLHILSKKVYKFKGQIFCGYLVWYGIGRFAIESLRTDSLMAGTMRASQLVAVLAVPLGIILFFVFRRHALSLPAVLTDGTTLMPATEPGQVEAEEGDENQDEADENADGTDEEEIAAEAEPAVTHMAPIEGLELLEDTEPPAIDTEETEEEPENGHAD
ncbi:MAG: prolipoprotein diacylglyceryl transferase [Clostridia bacterium]|nr:prolipoprotein diacylglyceryl transferase [Clostridia bacterium]